MWKCRKAHKEKQTKREKKYEEEGAYGPFDVQQAETKG